MSKLGLLQPIQFFERGGEEPFPGSTLIGCAPQWSFVSKAAENCIRANQRHNVLLFGYPGNGKRTLAKEFARTALRHRSFNVLWIDVASLISSPRQLAREAVELGSHHTTNSANQPLLRILDDIDALTVTAEENPNWKELESLLIREFFASSAQSILTLTISGHPSASLTTKLGNLAQYCAYFDWPDMTAVAEIFTMHGWRNANELASRLLFESKRDDVRYSTSALMKGASQVARLDRSLPDRNADDAIAILRSLCTPVDETEAVEYLTTESAFVARSVKEMSSYHEASQST